MKRKRPVVKEPSRSERKAEREWQKLIDKVNDKAWRANKPPVDR